MVRDKTGNNTKKPNKIIVTQTLRSRSYLIRLLVSHNTPHTSILLRVFRTKQRQHIFRVIFVIGRVWPLALFVYNSIVLFSLSTIYFCFMFCTDPEKSTKLVTAVNAVVTAAAKNEQRNNNKRAKGIR